MASPKRILITTGDPDGIGWEVTAKALARLGPRKDTQFFFFRHVSAAKSAPSLARAFRREVYSSLEQAVAEKFDPKVAVEIRSAKPAALWVEDATKACLRKQFHALVTAPLSKTSIIQAGLRDIGHTEILARVSNAQDLFMGFLGAKFSVVLMTGHEPLARAVGGFTARKLQAGLKAGDQLRSLLPKAKRRLPMAVVGMNPHAGEQGLLGREESWMFRELERAESEFGQVAGPLVAAPRFFSPH